MARKFHRMRSWCAAGSILAASTALVPTAAANDNPLARESRTARSKVSVKVAPGKWGSADLRDIQQFLQAVADEFQSFAGDPGAAPVRVRVAPRGGSPRVLYERGPEDAYVVHLTARNDAWFQYAYQFSHELCHIYSRFDHKDRHGDEVATGNQWFEESLCETAALYTLKRLAAAWTDQPPGRQWLGYGPVLTAYADFLQSQAHRHLPATRTFDQWYQENQTALRESPYLREKNELVASALLPLFEQDPGRWRAITHLNPHSASAGKGFGDFLADWHAACPEDERELVGQTMALFGFAPPTAGAPRLASLVTGSLE